MVKITSNPYQGLKPGKTTTVTQLVKVKITSNPYQGLKPGTIALRASLLR